jgi:GAF domain-containing protein
MTITADMHVYPIIGGEDAVGVLIAYTSHTDELVDNALGALALQLGPAIMQELRLPGGGTTGRLTRQIDMLRSLTEATKTVSSAMESMEVLNRGAKSLVEALKIDHSWIVVNDYTQAIGRVVAEYPDHGYVSAKIQLQGSPLQQRLMNERKPIVIPNVAENTEFGTNKELIDSLGMKGMIVLPMLVQDELIGSVGIDSYYEQRTFKPDEIEAAMAITSQLAVSVRNAQIYDEVKRRANQLERIADLSRRVTSTFNRNEIFQIIKEETLNLIETEQISVAVRDSDGSKLRLFVLDKAEPAAVEFQIEQTGQRLILTNAEPLMLDDISGSEYPDYKLLAQTGMRAALIVPLMVGGRTVGTYIVTHSQVGKYSSIDLAVLEQIGNQLAIALENARLYTQAAQRVEIEHLINQMGGSMAGTNDMQGILLSTVQQIAEALSARRARVRLQMTATQPTDMSKAIGKLLGKLSEKSEG